MGYEFPDNAVKNNESILVKQSDVPHNSQIVKLEYVCDFCGTKHYKTAANYYRDRDIIEIDNCSNSECKKKKKDLKNLKLYGTTNRGEIAKINNYNLGRGRKYVKQDIYNMAKVKGHEILNISSDNIIFKTRISVRCLKHNVDFETSVLSYMEDIYNCPECKREHLSEIHRECSIDDVAKICEEKNYTLLTDHISNVDDPVYYICNIHPEYGVQKTSLYGLKKYEHNCKLCHQPRGENHYNWQGGIADDRERDNDSFEYRRWRESVFKRDNYVCQCCGAKGKINAHHIVNYSSNKNLRYEKRNGITLCEECHLISYPDSFHKIYGNYNNTPE